MKYAAVPYSAIAALTPTASGKSLRQRPRTGRPRRAGQRVLFLDFDGVLHPTLNGSADTSMPSLSTTHFGWLPSLVSVLRPHPDLAVVVHSTWRFEFDDNELKEVLSDLGDRVLGATPWGERYPCILRWLQANPEYTDYRILDDEPSEFPTPSPAELIVCNPARGITAPEILAALREWLTL